MCYNRTCGGVVASVHSIQAEGSSTSWPVFCLHGQQGTATNHSTGVILNSDVVRRCFIVYYGSSKGCIHSIINFMTLCYMIWWAIDGLLMPRNQYILSGCY